MTNRLQTVMNLKSQTHRVKLFEIVLLSFFGVLMFVSQVIMAALPNIEIVSLLIIIVTCVFGVKTLSSVYIFVICEALYYGIHDWVIGYLFAWPVLCLLVLALRKFESKELFTLVAGIFGLLFEIFFIIPYFIYGGFAYTVAKLINGFVFSIVHCIGNLVLTYLLYNPLKRILEKSVKKQLKS